MLLHLHAELLSMQAAPGGAQHLLSSTPERIQALHLSYLFPLYYLSPCF